MRNYGQHNALLAGIRAARYAVTVTMDDDLQHPPEEIPKTARGAQPRATTSSTGCPRCRRHGYFADPLLAHPRSCGCTGCSGWRSRPGPVRSGVRTLLRQGFAHYDGPAVAIDALLAWTTARTASVEVRHEPRRHGRSQYTWFKLARLVIDLTTTFRTWPLRFASLVGFIVMLLGLGALAFVLGAYLDDGQPLSIFRFLASMPGDFLGRAALHARDPGRVHSPHPRTRAARAGLRGAGENWRPETAAMPEIFPRAARRRAPGVGEGFRRPVGHRHLRFPGRFLRAWGREDHPCWPGGIRRAVSRLGVGHRGWSSCPVPSSPTIAPGGPSCPSWAFRSSSRRCGSSCACRLSRPEQPATPVRLAVADDVRHIEEIASHAFRHGRYHADPRFPQELADRRYRRWVRTTLDSTDPMDRVYVLGHPGDVKGFFQLRLKKDHAEVGIIGVAKALQGSRAGPELVIGTQLALKARGSSLDHLQGVRRQSRSCSTW